MTKTKEALEDFERRLSEATTAESRLRAALDEEKTKVSVLSQAKEDLERRLSKAEASAAQAAKARTETLSNTLAGHLDFANQLRADLDRAASEINRLWTNDRVALQEELQQRQTELLAAQAANAELPNQREFGLQARIAELETKISRLRADH